MTKGTLSEKNQSRRNCHLEMNLLLPNLPFAHSTMQLLLLLLIDWPCKCIHSYSINLTVLQVLKLKSVPSSATWESLAGDAEDRSQNILHVQHGLWSNKLLGYLSRMVPKNSGHFHQIFPMTALLPPELSVTLLKVLYSWSPNNDSLMKIFFILSIHRTTFFCSFHLPTHYYSMSLIANRKQRANFGVTSLTVSWWRFYLTEVSRHVAICRLVIGLSFSPPFHCSQVAQETIILP